MVSSQNPKAKHIQNLTKTPQKSTKTLTTIPKYINTTKSPKKNAKNCLLFFAKNRPNKCHKPQYPCQSKKEIYDKNQPFIFMRAHKRNHTWQKIQAQTTNNRQYIRHK